MPFNGKSGKFNASINTVEFGCGDKAVKIGGENVLPLYTFDAPIENAPKIGVMISDLGLENEPAGVKAYYEGCTTIGEIAKKAAEMPGADFVCLKLEGADPNGADKTTEECMKAVKEVVDAIGHVEQHVELHEDVMNRSGKARVVGDGKRGARRGPQAPCHVARRKGQCNRRKQRHAKADDPSWVIAKPVVPAVSHALKGNKRQHYARQNEEHHNRRGAREEARTPRAKRLDHDVDVIQEHHQRPEPSQAVKRQDALLVTRHHHPSFVHSSRASHYMPSWI